MRKLLAFCLFISSVTYAEDLGLLLEGYKQESDFSKITKRDNASIVDIFTRDDLEKMQVHYLGDVLKTLPGIYISRGANNLLSASTPSSSSMPLTYTRLYINDHDVSSSSLGSAFVIWGGLPIEYIDHIEVYKATSSLEFGNENAALVIRLYTKKPEHDSGSKVALSTDTLGSVGGSFYRGNILENGVEYFAYGNVDSLQRTVYHHVYEDHTYDFNSDAKSYNLFANIVYNKWNVDIGSYRTKGDSFMGIGTYKTPTGGELDALQSYIHVTKNFADNLKMQFSYDRMEYERTYLDPNGISISTGDASSAIINDYYVSFHDDIVSLSLEKKLQLENHHLLAGGFYKYKGMHADGAYSDTNGSIAIRNSAKNVLNIFSLYLEDIYEYTQHTRFLASLKGDFFRYQKGVKSANEILTRVGIIQSYESFKYKLFYSKGYIPLTFYQQYNPSNTPYKANPNLDAMGNEFYTFSIEHNANSSQLKMEFAHMRIYNLVKYDRTTPNGWFNTSESSWRNYLQLDYNYMFDVNNKITTNFIFGNNSEHENYSPAFEALIKSFNSYKKFDFYNELIYKSSYTTQRGDLSLYVGSSIDFTSSVKYHYSKDLAFGMRGENILNDGYKQAYVGRYYNDALPVTDRKVWINMEYSF